MLDAVSRYTRKLFSNFMYVGEYVCMYNGEANRGREN